MQNEPKNRKEGDRIGYGVKVPPIRFNDAIESIKKLVTLAGESGSLDALAAILGHSRSSSNFSYKISALRNFGLITFDKLNYQLTDISKRIISPESSVDEMKAIQEAMSKQEILDRIWGNYKGKILPQREYLANYIEKTLEIPSQLKLQWADYFIEAALYANILIERESGSYQVLSEPLLIPRIEKESLEKIFDKVADDRGANGTKPNTTGQTNIDQRFEGLSGGLFYQKKISDNRKAMIYIPEDLTDADITMIRSIIKSVDAGLEGLKRHEPNEQ